MEDLAILATTLQYAEQSVFVGNRLLTLFSPTVDALLGNNTCLAPEGVSVADTSHPLVVVVQPPPQLLLCCSILRGTATQSVMFAPASPAQFHGSQQQQQAHPQPGRSLPHRTVPDPRTRHTASAVCRHSTCTRAKRRSLSPQDCPTTRRPRHLPASRQAPRPARVSTSSSSC